MSDRSGQAGTGAVVTLRVVGIARGNPGLAGAGIVLVDADGETVERVAKYLGRATILEAQLQALIAGLHFAHPYAPSPLRIAMGNETAARQLAAGYPARHPEIIRRLEEIGRLRAPFAGITYELGTGEELAEAEQLANMAIDTRLRPIPAYDKPIPQSS